MGQYFGLFQCWERMSWLNNCSSSGTLLSTLAKSQNRTNMSSNWSTNWLLFYVIISGGETPHRVALHSQFSNKPFLPRKLIWGRHKNLARSTPHYEGLYIISGFYLRVVLLLPAGRIVTTTITLVFGIIFWKKKITYIYCHLFWYEKVYVGLHADLTTVTKRDLMLLCTCWHASISACIH